MKKELLILSIAGVLLLSSLVPNAEVYASSSSDEKVTVITPDKINTLNKALRISQPNFDVTINGIAITDKYSMHPIIRYNNIAYFPLDWIYCNWLGLDISLNENNEIIINNTRKVNSFVSWRPELSSGVTNNLETTKINGIITNKVIINGKEYKNTSEAYPLLKYKEDIVYLPLTWNLTVNEFGWNSAWNAKTGLTINTKNTDKSATNLLLQTQVLSKINEFTYNNSAYINAILKPLETKESYKIELQKETVGIQENLNRTNYQLITDSYTNLYFESETATDKNKKTPIVIEGSYGVYEIDGYYYRFILEHEYEKKITDISVSGKSYLDDIHIIAGKVQKDGTFVPDDDIYQSLRNVGYLHEQTAEYNVCNNLLKFEFLSDRNKVLSLKKTSLYGFDESYKIEYETNDRNYLNPKVNTWDENTYMNQPKVVTKKTAIVSFKAGDVAQIIINDGQFEYNMSIKIIDN